MCNNLLNLINLEVGDNTLDNSLKKIRQGCHVAQWLVRVPHAQRPQSSTQSSLVQVPHFSLSFLYTIHFQIKTTVATKL